jgi:hypothetical protein
LASELPGRDIHYRAVDDDKYRVYLDELGMRESFIHCIAALYDAMGERWNNAPATTLTEVLGRTPVSGIDAVGARVEKWHHSL